MYPLPPRTFIALGGDEPRVLGDPVFRQRRGDAEERPRLRRARVPPVERAGAVQHHRGGRFRVRHHLDQLGAEQRQLGERTSEGHARARVREGLVERAAHEGGGAHGVGQP
jgi:hypothetical protein